DPATTTVDATKCLALYFRSSCTIARRIDAAEDGRAPETVAFSNALRERGDSSPPNFSATDFSATDFLSSYDRLPLLASRHLFAACAFVCFAYFVVDPTLLSSRKVFSRETRGTRERFSTAKYTKYAEYAEG
ncbi:MAG: hypothetical protein QHJ82_14800, partial [Verrucomicrobiota bacterium]|nr:hypothetical protein [Verrucomicrobiota bacterium]